MTITTGADAEAEACRYLQKQKLQLVARNFRCRLGEIDLIMRQQQRLIFIEVKYRKQSAFGHAEEMVSTSKQQKIIATAQLFLASHSEFQQFDCRFDVVAMAYDAQQQLSINWIQDAFAAH
ncbi:YraN family protein [Halioxenophilus sp. WMMB6]|uniref:YraN family protein n=1 Tax=Halioxenophilus sp. WMMB6 TaxID=3073815 RepID=UPI00295EA635|nr:YraN family protein [Halioxenophilus sp. WMMB6]